MHAASIGRSTKQDLGSKIADMFLRSSRADGLRPVRRFPFGGSGIYEMTGVLHSPDRRLGKRMKGDRRRGMMQPVTGHYGEQGWEPCLD